MEIRRLRRLDETLHRSGGTGDNWHMTWAADGRQYVSLTDGVGWPGREGYTGKKHNTRVYAITGAPPGHEYRYLPGFPDLFTEEGDRTNRYYGFGILSLGEAIYNFLTTPTQPFLDADPPARFCGAKLIYSPDRGASWRNQDGSALTWEPWSQRARGNMLFFEEPGEAFSLLTVLQMGRDYEHNRDGYVYLYSPNGNEDGTMNQLVLARVAREAICDRAAYRFYAGTGGDGAPRWSEAIEDRNPVHVFPSGWVNTHLHPYAWHPSVVYLAPLGLYLMANWGMGTSSDGWWFGKPSYLGFWTAREPWGPWEQVHEEAAWTPLADANARAYQPQIAPGWIAADGRSFWMVYTDFQTIDEERPYYCFNCQRVEMEVG